MTRMLEMFACEPLGCRLTRKACAERHRAANRKASGPGAAAMEAARHQGSPCTGCEVGRAHVRESADVPEAVDAPRPSEEASMSKAGHGKRQQQVLELVRKEPGLHAKEIALRLDMGVNNSGTVLRRLMERGQVRFEGSGHSRTWFPADGAEAPDVRATPPTPKPKRRRSPKPVETDPSEHPDAVELLLFGGYECDCKRIGNRLLISIEAED